MRTVTVLMRKPHGEISPMLSRSWIEEMNPIADQSSLFTDLLGSALGEVDWYEIAENGLEDVDKTVEPEADESRRYGGETREPTTPPHHNPRPRTELPAGRSRMRLLREAGASADDRKRPGVRSLHGRG